MVLDVAGRPRVYLDIAIDAMPVGRIVTWWAPTEGMFLGQDGTEGNLMISKARSVMI